MLVNPNDAAKDWVLPPEWWWVNGELRCWGCYKGTESSETTTG